MTTRTPLGTRSFLGALLIGSLMGCVAEDQRTDTLDPARAQQRRESFPEAGLAQLDSGNVAYGEEQYEAALAHYHEALALDAEFADAHFNLGRVLEQLGRRDEALRHLLAYRRITEGREG